MTKNAICLWFDKDAEAAAHFFAKTFPDSAVAAVFHALSDNPNGTLATPPSRRFPAG